MITELIHIGLAGAFLMLPPTAALRVDDPDSRSALLPYGGAPTSLEPAPAGYEPVFVESLNRHGSRALTTPADVDNVLALWRSASSAGALTDLGRRFGHDVRQLHQDNIDLGYGDLSALGATELRGIGRRTAQRLPSLLDADARVDVRTSGADRATDSGRSFAMGLTDEVPGIEIGKPEVDRKHLRFDRDDPNYQRFRATDRETRDALAAVDDLPAATRAAGSLLSRLYEASFVRQIDDPVTQARAIFSLYAIGPAMRQESDVDLDTYLTDREAAALAQVADAHLFYKRGPGISGSNDSFAPASVLLDDFFAAIDERLGGGQVTAVFRFGHAEQVIPLAALLGLPGSNQPAEPRHPFSWDNNPWRGAEVSRLAANIQWIVYDHPAREALVAMLYNERPIPFRDDCRPFAEDGYVFKVSELRRCLL